MFQLISKYDFCIELCMLYFIPLTIQSHGMSEWGQSRNLKLSIDIMSCYTKNRKMKNETQDKNIINFNVRTPSNLAT